jgi:hypothetical protein
MRATLTWGPPSPLESLLTRRPVYERWVASLPPRVALPLHQLGLEFSDGDHVGPGVVVLDKELRNSPEWLTLKGSLAQWAAEFKFCDVWIERIALCTLQKYAAGWSESDKDFCDWRLKPDLEPKPNFTAPPMQWNERLDDYYKHCQDGLSTAIKAEKRRIEFQTGARKGEVQPAEWTAAYFRGAALGRPVSFAAIAKSENLVGNEISPRGVEDAIERFRKRAGLTMPEGPLYGGVHGSPILSDSAVSDNSLTH